MNIHFYCNNLRFNYAFIRFTATKARYRVKFIDAFKICTKLDDSIFFVRSVSSGSAMLVIIKSEIVWNNSLYMFIKLTVLPTAAHQMMTKWWPASGDAGHHLAIILCVCIHTIPVSHTSASSWFLVATQCGAHLPWACPEEKRYLESEMWPSWNNSLLSTGLACTVRQLLHQSTSHITINNSTNVDLMLGQRRRRWTNIKSVLAQRPIFAGIVARLPLYIYLLYADVVWCLFIIYIYNNIVCP